MLIHRILTQSEAVQLHAELKTTPNILGYTVREITGFRDVFIAEVDGAFAGACASKDLLFGWTDIAMLYVLPDFRGQGLGTELYTAAWQRASEKTRHIFTMSRNPAVLHLMKRFGTEITGAIWRAPVAFHLHMQCHMTSAYRFREAIRKSIQLKTEGPVLIGVKRHGNRSGAGS